jgi:hypothetical protein
MAVPQYVALEMVVVECGAPSLSVFVGSSITNVVPRPGWLRTVILPPWSVTID